MLWFDGKWDKLGEINIFYRLTNNFSIVFYIANNDSNFWKWCLFYIKKSEPVAAEIVLNCYF